MKLIKLTKGYFVKVDDKNYDWLIQWKWCVNENDKKTHNYAVRNSKMINGKRHLIFMHKLIMNTPNGYDCDHINNDTLDCQEQNLRNCLHKENIRNHCKRLGSSKYFGVSIQGKYIYSRIWIDNKAVFLGSFKSEELAAQEYDKMARIHFGEFANLNFK